MTKKKFEKKRRHLLYMLMVQNREDGLDYNFKLLNKCGKPKFNDNIRSYEQAWEMLKPLRDVVRGA